jgi:hypothetical protein
MRRATVGIALLGLALAAATPAAAEEEHEPPVGVALGLGVAVAAVPLCAGGVRFATSDEVGVRQQGLWTMLAGLTVAPVVGHLVVREWARAGIFAIAPLAGSVVTLALVQSYPELLDHGHPAVRVSFGFGLSLAVVGAVVGLGDLPGASDRWRKRRARVLAAAPLIGGGSGGVGIGGHF